MTAVCSYQTSPEPLCNMSDCNALEEEGHYYFNARWYDASTGRFISEDPIRAGVNWNIYVNNNPLNFIDPTGLDPRKNGGQDYDTPDFDRNYDNDDDGGSEPPKKNNEPEKKWCEKGIWKKWSDINSEAKVREQQWQLNRALRMAGVSVQDLNELLNIDHLGNILSDPDNRGYYDEVTQQWMNSFGNQDDLSESIMNQLSNTKVFTLDSDKVKLMNRYLDGTGLSIGGNSMMGIGNFIYNNTGTLNPNNISMNSAALLGHEAIHGIQARAHRGLSNFLGSYASSDGGEDIYPTGPLEKAAYEFGGSRGHDPSRNSIQVLKNKRKYGEWWK